MDINEGSIFTTTNVDLATFLIMQEIKLLEVAIHDPKRKIIAFRFLDEKLNCLDLERVYLNSEYKKFRDVNKYLLSKVHEKLREI